MMTRLLAVSRSSSSLAVAGTGRRRGAAIYLSRVRRSRHPRVSADGAERRRPRDRGWTAARRAGLGDPARCRGGRCVRCARRYASTRRRRTRTCRSGIARSERPTLAIRRLTFTFARGPISIEARQAVRALGADRHPGADRSLRAARLSDRAGERAAGRDGRARDRRRQGAFARSRLHAAADAEPHADPHAPLDRPGGAPRPRPGSRCATLAPGIRADRSTACAGITWAAGSNTRSRSSRASTRLPLRPSR